MDVVASRDMFLANMAAGHLPPLRNSTLRTVKHPYFASEPCKVPGCTVRGCLGNRLLWSRSGEGVVSVRMIVVHHKTERHPSSQPIDVKLPATLVSAIAPYVEHGWAHLVRMRCEASQRPQQLLLDDKARPLQSNGLDILWDRLLRKYNNNIFSQYFPITRLRHAFVGDIRSGEASLPPSVTEEGLAMIMGNSTRLWDNTYDAHRKRRLMQQGADGMAVWRTGILQRTGAEASTTGAREHTQHRPPQQQIAIPGHPGASSRREQLTHTIRGEEGGGGGASTACRVELHMGSGANHNIALNPVSVGNLRHDLQQPDFQQHDGFGLRKYKSKVSWVFGM